MKQRKTVLDLQRNKADNQKITMMTAYDYSMARIINQTDVDSVLVGDSLGMVVQGHTDTLSVTMDDMVYHARCVHRGLDRAHLVVDMPFMSYQISVEEALRNAGRLVKEGGAQSVKLEGGAAVCPQIRAIVLAGIPVVGHLGLTPQAIHALGGFKVQGKAPEARTQMIEDALRLQDAGVSMLVLEMVPATLAAEITAMLDIPTIGIGAGPHCDGQVLVCNDLLGFDLTFAPRFLKRYAELETQMVMAIQQYVREVGESVFPSVEHSFAVSNRSVKTDAKLSKLY